MIKWQPKTLLPNEFFARYADMRPIRFRFIKLDFKNEPRKFSMTEIYQKISELENQMRPLRIEQDRWLKLAADYFYKDEKE